MSRMIGSGTNGTNAVNHFGRVTSPIILTEDNAWQQKI